MTKTRSWQRNRDMWIEVLKNQTGEGLAVWNRRIRRQAFNDEPQLRTWLAKRQVTGYAQQLLVMESFGYPDFVLATADELIARQYVDHPRLKAIYDAIVDAAAACGEVIIQARKTYVSLVSPRRTFARIQRTSKAHVVLGLRLNSQRPSGRLQPSRIHETMRLQVNLSAPADVDPQVRHWLRRAYADNV